MLQITVRFMVGSSFFIIFVLFVCYAADTLQGQPPLALLKRGFLRECAESCPLAVRLSDLKKCSFSNGIAIGYTVTAFF